MLLGITITANAGLIPVVRQENNGRGNQMQNDFGIIQENSAADDGNASNPGNGVHTAGNAASAGRPFNGVSFSVPSEFSNARRGMNPSFPKEDDVDERFSGGDSNDAVYQSAMIIPEPATMVILGLGSLTLLRRKK
jgi:hypothetical protein